jgi:hypothetical protein
MTRLSNPTPVLVSLALALVIGTGTAAAAQPDEVKVGKATVLAGETGTRADVALDEAAAAAVRAELEGRSIGILMFGPDISEEDPEVQGAKAAIEALGAAALFCETLETRRRAVRCGGEPIHAAIIYTSPNVPPFLSYPLDARAVRQGVPFVRMGAPQGWDGRDGSVEIVFDRAAWGLATGRAAGAWAAEAWPDREVTVAVGSFGVEDDPFPESVSQGVLEVLPSATIAQLSPDPQESVTADLYTGGIFGERMTSLLEGGTSGVDGQPIAVFLPFCPEPLPTGPSFAGCLRIDREDIGAAAVDVIAGMRAGRATPAEILVGEFEVIRPGESAD